MEISQGLGRLPGFVINNMVGDGPASCEICFFPHKPAGNCTKVSLEICSGFTLTNGETQTTCKTCHV